VGAVSAPLPVTVAIVTHDDADELPGCFAALAALRPPVACVRVADCASADGSAEAAAELGRRHALPLEVAALGENRGFAGGMNAALAADSSPWVLSLNADARPQPDAVERMLARGLSPRLRTGAVTPRLVRPAAGGAAPLLDACGMRLTPAWRHHDRGSGRRDRGQWQTPERVFGATGAAALLRRAALDDVAVAGDPFDPLFHSYREDAELAFRLRERGWEVVYEPAALVVHRRVNLPSRRRRMRAAVNYHSLKNRYLLRIYHQTAWNLLWTALPAGLRDLQALAWVLLRERSSLAAYRWLWHHRHELWRRRRLIQERRTVAPRDLDRWFLRAAMPL
jgi:GT2 family glycosyltransferase